MSLWLAKDQQSNEVAALQNALNIHLQPKQPLLLDGVFGDHTEGAVKDFQKCQGLKSDGIAGPATLNALFERAEIIRTVHLTALDDPMPPQPMPVSSPYDPFRQPRHNELDPALEEFMSCWQRREAPMMDWMCQTPPKRSLPPLMPDPPAVTPPPVPPAPRPRRPVPKEVALDPEHPTGKAAYFSDEWLKFEAATEVGAKSLKELETEFAFSLAMVRMSPLFAPAFGVAVTPEGKWRVQWSLQVLKRPFKEWEYIRLARKLGTVSIEPQIAGVVALNHEMKRPELSLSAGVGLQAERILGRLGRHEFSVFWGLGVAAVLSNSDRLRGLSAGPSYGGQATFSAGVKYGLKKRERRH